MRWLFSFALLLPACIRAQEPTQPPTEPLAQPPAAAQQVPASLPDSPGATETYRQNISVTAMASLPPCKRGEEPRPVPAGIAPSCAPRPDLPYQRFLNSTAPFPPTPRPKGLLAIHDVVDPANLFTITANAAFTIGIESHTGYGPGLKGFGRDIGYSLVQDGTGEFVSTFALDSLFREDPHYHRSPRATVPRRFLHALSHTVRSQHDDGTPMPNYSTLLTYPISAEISNLYVPGVHGNGPSTVKRVVIGLASNPIDDLITEFLPDFAKRVHVRVIFVQQVLNNLASGQPL